MKIVFISGPFRGDGSVKNKELNVENARKFVRIFIENEIPFYSPHLNIDQEMISLPEGEGKFSWDLNAEFLKKCEALAVLPGWENSNGTKKEIEIAKQYGLPVFYLEKEESIKQITDWIKS